jgi:hypothetical protein
LFFCTTMQKFMNPRYNHFCSIPLLLIFILVLSFERHAQAQQKLIHYWDFNDTYPYNDGGAVAGTPTQSDSLGTANVITTTGPARGDTLYALPASYTTLSNANPHIRYIRPQGLQGNALVEDSIMDNAAGGSYLYDYCSKHYSYFKHSDSTHTGKNCYIKSLQPNLNSYFYLYMPTTGYHNINLYFALSGSGFNMAQYMIFSYSVDGGNNWKNLTQAMDTFNLSGVRKADTLLALNGVTATSRWYPVNINFGSDTTVSNNSNFVLRFTFALASAGHRIPAVRVRLQGMCVLITFLYSETVSVLPILNKLPVSEFVWVETEVPF